MKYERARRDFKSCTEPCPGPVLHCKKYKWRWLFHQRVVGKKMWFFPPPEASIGRMIKPLGMRRVQTSSSNPPMLDYPKNQRFLTIFSLLVNSCWPHVHHTCNLILGVWSSLTIWSYDQYSLRGVEKTYFFPYIPLME